jgi:hypothetical protein
VPIVIPHTNQGCDCVNSFTKVVTQFIQFLSDSGSADTLDREFDVVKQEDFEPVMTSWS